MTVYVMTETTVDWDGWATGSPTLIGVTASKAEADEFEQTQRMHLRRDVERKELGGVERVGHMALVMGQEKAVGCPADCGGDDVYRVLGSDRG